VEEVKRDVHHPVVSGGYEGSLRSGAPKRVEHVDRSATIMEPTRRIISSGQHLSNGSNEKSSP